MISSKGAEWTKTFKLFHFRANPDAIKVLKTASIDYVSLANNHSFDYGGEALQEMLELLDSSGIRHSGAGMNLKEAAAYAILKVGLKKVAVLSLTDNQPEWEASPTCPGKIMFHFRWTVIIQIDLNPASSMLEKMQILLLRHVMWVHTFANSPHLNM